jgi:ureidoglycolate lyase
MWAQEKRKPMRRKVTMNAPLTVTATPIDAASFAPYGDMLLQPPGGNRTDWSAALANPRPQASISLTTANVPMTRFPAPLRGMERHPFSFQTFIPLDASGYLVCVAPGGADDLPAMDQMRAFIVPAGMAITYHANAWHHPMLALDRPGQFAILMWMSGGDDDEEFVDLGQPVTVRGT